MKKLNGLALVALLSGVSFGALANPVAIAPGGLIAALDCPLLAEDVRIPLSTGVVAARNCTGAGLAIRVAACHTSGRVGERTIEVPCRAASDTSTENAALPVCTTAGATVNRVTNSGAAIMRGLTTGGQVGPTPIDGALCNQAAVNGRIGN